MTVYFNGNFPYIYFTDVFLFIYNFELHYGTVIAVPSPTTFDDQGRVSTTITFLSKCFTGKYKFNKNSAKRLLYYLYSLF